MVEVGCAEAIIVGFKDGDCVFGLNDGALEGIFEGIDEGTEVTLLDGAFVGLPDGDGDPTGAGKSIGLPVGYKISSTIISPQSSMSISSPIPKNAAKHGSNGPSRLPRSIDMNNWSCPRTLFCRK